jgi:hypothetical protein
MGFSRGFTAVFVSFFLRVKYTGDISLVAGVALEERGFDQQIDRYLLVEQHNSF